MDHPAHRRLAMLVSLGFILLVGGPVHGTQRTLKPGAKQVTRASWYGASFQGRRTAGGGIFNPQHFTAAHPTLHLGSRVKVTELRTGRSVIVRITDRGPYLAGRGIDLSYAAARQLGMVRRGVARVQVELLGYEPKPPVVTALNGTTISWLPKAILE